MAENDNEVAGLGTALQMGEEAGSLDEIAQLMKLTPHDAKVATQETTLLSSTAEEHAPSIPDYGSVKGMMKYWPQFHQILHELIAAPAKRYWAIVFPDDGQETHEFRGTLVALGLQEVDAKTGAIMASFEIKTSGPLTIS